MWVIWVNWVCQHDEALFNIHCRWKNMTFSFSSERFWLSLIQQHRCKRAKLRQNNNQHFLFEDWRKRKEAERQRGDSVLTWNMTLYCSSGFWTTHMLHPIMTFWLCRSKTWPVLKPGLSLSRSLSVAVGEPHPHSQACSMSHYSSSEYQHIPAEDGYTLYVAVSLCFLFLFHNSSVIIQSELKCGDGFRAAGPRVCFCLHCRLVWVHVLVVDRPVSLEKSCF